MISKLLTRKLTKICFYFVVFALSLQASVFAASITFVQTGTGTGQIGTTAFSNAHFTITAQSNTDNRINYPAGTYFENHDWATISIDGVGYYSFTTPTRTFDNHSSGCIGFSRAGEEGIDLYAPLYNTSFNHWDMLSSIGPISGNAQLELWGSPYSPVNTTGGDLYFNTAFCPCTFQAYVGTIPEPSTFILLGMGLAGLLAFACKRRK